MEQEPLLLDAKLEQLKESLKASLAEVCDQDVGRLDTGQLVRIEEVLVVAHEAAKEAVSIRRKRRRRPRGTTPVDMEHPTGVGAHRVFVDTNATSWDVFAVLPPARGKTIARLPGPFQQGWLCFDSMAEKRRLSPIPDGWETATDDELLRLRDRALIVPNRSAPPEPPDIRS